MFKYQTTAFPNSFAADWIDSLPNECLEKYAIRFAGAIRQELSNRPPTAIIVCGLSLGGMVAPYVARELGASGCILLATICKPSQFPRRYYALWRLMQLCPPLRLILLFFIRWSVRFLLYFPWFVRCFANPDVVRSVIEMPFFCLSGLFRMMFDWAYHSRSLEENVGKIFNKPVLHVHGTNDWLLPIRRTNPDIRIESGGHELVLTHPEKINGIIERFVVEIESTPVANTRIYD